MSHKPLAFIGDAHACELEMKLMLEALSGHGIDPDRIVMMGDLEDRGPNPGACTRLAQQSGLLCIQGNHERSLVRHARDAEKGKTPSFKPWTQYKKASLDNLSKEDIDYLANLPRMLEFPEHNIVAVHAGVSPHLPLYAQDHLIDEVQLVNKLEPEKSLWWGEKTVIKYGKSEEELRGLGWNRWYLQHQASFDVVFGHSVFTEGPLFAPVNGRRVFGIDTGCVYGGYLTALILKPEGRFLFIHVKARNTYYTEGDFKYDFSQFKPKGKVY